MDFHNIITELKKERARLDGVVQVLQQLVRPDTGRRSLDRPSLAGKAASAKVTPITHGRRKLSAAARRRISEAQKRRWAKAKRAA